MSKLKIDIPILVEGKYDKITLLSVLDASIFTTGGFSVFNNKEKQALLRRLAEEKGLIVLTDSDGGGKQIRSFLSGILPKEKIRMLYIPKIEGKERRKSHKSKDGFLGVEGMTADLLRSLFAPFAVGESKVQAEKRQITKTDFYLDGLSGGDGAKALRATLARAFSLPEDMTANAFLEALNLLSSYEEYKSEVERWKGGE
ncbi:MAG: DUF4093 domain-containing protein [Clostridia bacterium]|nr:DUF4093 domain-containing protein [Clostridia bacterium]